MNFFLTSTHRQCLLFNIYMIIYHNNAQQHKINKKQGKHIIHRKNQTLITKSGYDKIILKIINNIFLIYLIVEILYSDCKNSMQIFFNKFKNIIFK